MSLKRKSENTLKEILKGSYNDPRKRTFDAQKYNISKKVAFYLQSKGLIKMTVYENARINVHLNDNAFSYFEDKKDKLIHNILFSFVIPIIISFITTLVTLLVESGF